MMVEVDVITRTGRVPVRESVSPCLSERVTPDDTGNELERRQFTDWTGSF